MRSGSKDNGITVDELLSNTQEAACKTRKDNCKNCRFWDDTGGGQGDCHRYPPHVVDRLDKLDLWPVTMDLDWCGEHQRRGAVSPVDF